MSTRPSLIPFSIISTGDAVPLARREQVDALDNARLREGIEVKPSDSRSQTYLAEHGDRCWEVDILPATVIEQELDAHIRSWLDERLWRQRDREIERARTLI